MDNKYAKYFEVNKETWNKKVVIHSKSEFYNVDEFLKGKSSLNAYEIEELGDVKGKSILHLQCHFGQDTLSLARLGAKCTGIDLSNEGIKKAEDLNIKLGLDVNFVESNLYDVSEKVEGTFDIVFASYGVIGWLPDLKPWGKMIAERLKKGGTFFMAEFHPIVWMFDYLDDKPIMKYGYMQDEVIYEEYEGTYADETSKMLSKEYGWNHGISEVVNALIEAGLHIEYLKEFDESPYDVLPNLVKTDSEMFTTEEKLYPLIFTLKASKFLY